MKKILLIEDSVELRENTTEILELAQYHVISAENGKKGVELAIQNQPDLIICDIMMPVLDGYGAFHLLSKNATTNSIPFIFMSAKADRIDLRRGMEMGADDYLTKPFNDTELLNAIESRLQKSERLRSSIQDNLQNLDRLLAESQNKSDMSSLTTMREIKRYRRREFVYEEGAYPQGVFFVSSGKVKSFRANEGGKEYITALFRTGDFFGYVALMEEKPYTESAEVLEDSDVCFVPKSDFFSLLHGNAEVSRRFIKMLADDLNEREEQLLRLAYNSVRKRVAEALITINRRYNCDGVGEYSISISREDIAQLAGTATETTIRTLSDFRSESLIDIKGSAITILNHSKLVTLNN